jgi:hypothetical protein
MTVARARNIKPGFFSNEALAECSISARLCFVGLWLLADRDGRLEDRPKKIKGELFRFDSIEVEPLLIELDERAFIVRYVVDGVRVIQIPTFTKHQKPHPKEKPSTLPAIPAISRATVLAVDADFDTFAFDQACADYEEEAGTFHGLNAMEGGGSREKVRSVAACDTKSSAIEPKPEQGDDEPGKGSTQPALNVECLNVESLNPSLLNGSDPGGSGATAPPEPARVPAPQPTPAPPPPPPPSDRDLVFANGVALLTAAGVTDRNARSLLAAQCKTHGEAAVRQALEACAREAPIQPVPWLQAALSRNAHRARGPTSTEALKAGVKRRLGFGSEAGSEVVDA